VVTQLIHALTNLVLLQAPSATVQGTVRDAESGAPLRGAIVALPDLRRTATAGSDGRYRFADVPPGFQHVSVRFLGFAPRMLHALVPPQGALEINLSLRAVALHLRPIEVRPPMAFHGVEEDSAGFPDRSVSIAAVRDHPLLAEPDGLMALGGGEVSTAGSFEAGKHGARAGVIMRAHPKLGQITPQEFAPGVAEDKGRVLDLDATVTVPYGTLRHCLKQAEFTSLEPAALEHKFYCPGIGIVRERDVRGGTVNTALVNVRR
jgi:carboxypeptidase family protein